MKLMISVIKTVNLIPFLPKLMSHREEKCDVTNNCQWNYGTRWLIQKEKMEKCSLAKISLLEQIGGEICSDDSIQILLNWPGSLRDLFVVQRSHLVFVTSSLFPWIKLLLPLPPSVTASQHFPLDGHLGKVQLYSFVFFSFTYLKTVIIRLQSTLS